MKSKFNNVILSAVALLVCVCFFAACGSKSADDVKNISKEEMPKGNAVASVDGKKDGKLSVVCTIFPEYDWAKEVIGDQSDRFELTLLLDNGVDLHSYQPTAADIAKIAQCDLFVYVGGESDEWVEDALAEAINPDMKVINLLEVLGDEVKEEEIVEGMQGEDEDDDHDEHDHDDHDDHDHDDHDHDDHDHDEHDHDDHDEHDHDEHDDHDHDEHDHDHEGHEHHHHEGEIEYDEHVWLSLKKAKTLTNAIADAICEIDPESKDAYAANAAAYVKKLDELDAKYEKAVSEGTKNTVLFADRFPFRYLVDDYDLDYYAAFVGCSAETEASFETVVFLAGKVDELKLSTVLVIENSDKKIAQTVVNNTGAKNANILVMDSLQSTTSEDIKSGKSYFGAMEENLAVLAEAVR